MNVKHVYLNILNQKITKDVILFQNKEQKIVKFMPRLILVQNVYKDTGKSQIKNAYVFQRYRNVKFIVKFQNKYACNVKMTIIQTGISVRREKLVKKQNFVKKNTYNQICVKNVKQDIFQIQIILNVQKLQLVV